jgi:ribosomal protein S12 methylthiotransferase accessory factor
VNVETLVSPRTGIVSRVRLAELAADDPPLHWAMSYGCDTTPIGGLRGHNDGNAAAATRERAVLKAVGESVERYCAAIYDEDELVLASFDELEGPATPPERFALFSDRQYAEPGFRFPPFTRETVVRWVRGRSLVHDRLAWVPAQFVYVPYRCHRREPALHDLISTGLAAGPTFAWAAYRAALEPIERDAFSIAWNNRLARPRIDLAPVDDPVLDAFRTVPVRVDAVLLTLDIPVPVVLVVVQTTTDRPPLTAIGLGTDLNPARALSLALEEAGIGFLACGVSRPRPSTGRSRVTRTSPTCARTGSRMLSTRRCARASSS